jgi:hypothetical protein
MEDTDLKKATPLQAEQARIMPDDPNRLSGAMP